MPRLGQRLVAPALVATLAVGGCASGTGGPLGGILGGIVNPAGANTVAGTVAGVDTRSQIVYVNTTSGQQLPVQYDNNTQVVYQNQKYPVVDLQRGDYVTVQLQGTGNGGYFTSYIQVTQSVQNSSQAPGNQGRYQTLGGRVSQINYQNGTFLLTQNNGARILVQMPYNPRQNDAQTFNSLRNGQYVQVQGQFLSQSTFQLSTFS